MRTRLTAAVTISLFLATATTVSALGRGASGDRPSTDLPADDRARGLVHAGLRPAADGSECSGGFEVELDSGTLCTHGPDAAPDHLDVRAARSIADLRHATLELPTVARSNGFGPASPADAAATGTGGSTAGETGIVPVIGDGVSGSRVQAVYAVAEDRTDRYADVAPLIANWAAHVNAMVNESAALTGGERHVRYVTDSAGALVVERVVLPAAADDDFRATISALQALGFDDPSRKYLLWVDSNVYCGIANIYGDDSPNPDNRNNGRSPMYGRVDSGCWGKANSVELHELVHTMGGVQQSSPHVTPGWHCTDESDRMCYRDSADVTLTATCPSWMEAYLDCGHDDYFHTSPSPGSYLDSHWNVANSSFLHAGPVGGDPPPPVPDPNEAPVVLASGPSSIVLGEGAALDGTVIDDDGPGPYTVAWSQASGPGTASFADATAEDTTVSFSSAGTYRLTLTADDGDLTGSATVTIAVAEPTPPPPPPDPNEAPVVLAWGPSTVVLGEGAVVHSSVSDDGLPGPYSVAWSVVAGPGAVTFADAAAENTSAAFSAAGTYYLALTADDGELTGSAGVTIVVTAPPTDPVPVTETFSGSLNKKWPTRTFDTTVATGPVSAALTFGSTGGRGKKASADELTLRLLDGSGGVVAIARGPSVVSIGCELAAGTYTWEVSSGSSSFSLEVTHLG